LQKIFSPSYSALDELTREQRKFGVFPSHFRLGWFIEQPWLQGSKPVSPGTNALGEPKDGTEAPGIANQGVRAWEKLFQSVGGAVRRHCLSHKPKNLRGYRDSDVVQDIDAHRVKLMCSPPVSSAFATTACWRDATSVPSWLTAGNC